MIRRPLLCAVLPLLAACRGAGPAVRGGPDAGRAIEIVLAGAPGSRWVEVWGLPDVAEPQGGWAELFSLSVASARRAGGPAILGRHAFGAGRLLFEPRYPLQPELEYTATLRLALLPDATGSEPDLVRSLTVPRTQAAIAPVVTAIYPTARPLPANVLKFYVHFSRPMARGYAYEHAHVLDAAGSQVEQPFPELGEELWNPEGTRLTLLVDPGRIKRGLLLHEELGPVLEEGRRYALVIEAGWPGADRAALATETRIDFTTVAADMRQPDPTRWSLVPPPASSRQPLIVSLDEPLDHALLQHMLRVVGADGHALQGSVTIDPGEMRWSFVPTHPWRPVAHALLVDADLEDLAGNSVGRLFETQADTTSPATRPGPVQLPFQPAL